MNFAASHSWSEPPLIEHLQAGASRGMQRRREDTPYCCFSGPSAPRLRAALAAHADRRTPRAQFIATSAGGSAADIVQLCAGSESSNEPGSEAKALVFPWRADARSGRMHSFLAAGAVARVRRLSDRLRHLRGAASAYTQAGGWTAASVCETVRGEAAFWTPCIGMSRPRREFESVVRGGGAGKS